MSKTIHSPIKSFGGKGSNGFLKIIYSLFPKEYDVMVEPFAGSAVITLNNPKEKCTEIINDLNKNIYSFYKSLQDKELFKKLKEKLDLTCYHENLFEDSKNELLKDDLDLVERAYHFFVVNRISYSGNLVSFGKNYAVRRNMSKSTSDMLSTIDGLDVIHKRISQMIILDRDAIKLIENNNFENTFFYLDPPYCHSTRTSTRYPVDFSDEQQEQLMDVITKSKAKILLSGYDNELYEQKLVQENNWKKVSYEVNTISGTNKPKTKIECLWYNFENN